MFLNCFGAKLTEFLFKRPNFCILEFSNKKPCHKLRQGFKEIKNKIKRANQFTSCILLIRFSADPALYQAICPSL